MRRSGDDHAVDRLVGQQLAVIAVFFCLGKLLQDLLAAADAPWTGAPQGSVIGHVHLQVGDVAKAEDFYMNQLGLERSAHIFGASFFASGGYHHHLAGNIWNSRGAGQRSPGAAGLAEVVLAADAPVLAGLASHDLADPWGTRIRLVAKG